MLCCVVFFLLSSCSLKLICDLYISKSSYKIGVSFFWLLVIDSSTSTCISLLYLWGSARIKKELFVRKKVLVGSSCDSINLRLSLEVTLTCLCRPLMYSTANSSISAVLVCCKERSIDRSNFFSLQTSKLYDVSKNYSRLRIITLSMSGNSSCSFFILSLIRVLLIWNSSIQRLRIWWVRVNQCRTMRVWLKEERIYPLCNASWVRRASSFRPNLVRNRILECEKLLYRIFIERNR